jgi:hypothetical protein
MAKMADNDKLLVGLLVAIGLGSLIDLAGRRTYQGLHAEMPDPQSWTPGSAFSSSAQLLSETRSMATGRGVPA